MEFSKFAEILRPIIGGSYSTHLFTRTLFESIITKDYLLQIEDISDNTFKAYYNGKTKITNIAKRVLPHIEQELFISYLDDFPDATTQRLCDAFQTHIKDINLYNASQRIANLFEEILTEAASQKRKSTPKSAKKTNDKTPHDILAEKMLASRQAVEDVLDETISNLATAFDQSVIELPEEHSSDEYPYSSEDKLLLQEFTSDYDVIMVTIIKENYTSALVDMSLPSKIQELYTSKWNSRADAFLDPTLKSYVFGLLGELNKLSKSFLASNLEPSFIKNTRTKIRNLYVNLHPDSFAVAFPYDAFIDDWDDGEY